MKTYTTIQEIIAANRAIGNYFFDAGALKFFNSKIEPEIFHGCVFITSEKQDREYPRLWTVRLALQSGAIEEVSKFQAFSTKSQAVKYAKSLPVEIQGAMQNFLDEFNGLKTKSQSKFIEHALIEPKNSGAYSRESFCGACTWLLLNYETNGLRNVAKDLFEAFKKRLGKKFESLSLTAN